MPIAPALAAAIQSTTLESMNALGAHDAVVIGGGATGGMAALLLAESGLRVLVLDAGKPLPVQLSRWHRGTCAVIRALGDPTGLRFIPPAVVPVARAALRGLRLFHQPIQSRCRFWSLAPEMYVDDAECRYSTERNRPFAWIRARQLGGRMTVPGHGRTYLRRCPSEIAASDQSSGNWPLAPLELDPWYSLIERRLQLRGTRDGIPWLPDSELAQILAPTANEDRLISLIRSRWPQSRPILGRFAPPLDSLGAAAETGKIQCRPGAVVSRINVDGSGRASGVTWIDQLSGGSEVRVSCPLVFLCASALESTRLLLLSQRSNGSPGLSPSDALGRYLMDHTMISGWYRGPPLLATPPLEDGRGVYMPRFDARADAAPSAKQGFGVHLYQFSSGQTRSYIAAVSFGEMAPRPENRVTLHPAFRDAWGLPVLHIDCHHNRADLALGREQTEALREIAPAIGATLSKVDKHLSPPGLAIHECGTARMGRTPRESVLDPNNQYWGTQGLYVTDAASYPSQGIQNPTLTALALTARACHHAVSS